MTRIKHADSAASWLLVALLIMAAGWHFGNAPLGLAAWFPLRWAVARIIAAVEAGQVKVEDFGQNDA